MSSASQRPAAVVAPEATAAGRAARWRRIALALMLGWWALLAAQALLWWPRATSRTFIVDGVAQYESGEDRQVRALIIDTAGESMTFRCSRRVGVLFRLDGPLIPCEVLMEGLYRAPVTVHFDRPAFAGPRLLALELGDVTFWSLADSADRFSGRAAFAVAVSLIPLMVLAWLIMTWLEYLHALWWSRLFPYDTRFVWRRRRRRGP